jgi:hypothetical protein
MPLDPSQERTQPQLHALTSIQTQRHFLVCRSWEPCNHTNQISLDQWSSTCGTCIPGGKRTHITSIRSKHRNRLNLEPALIHALTKIRPRIEVLACQKQAQSSY